jgi:iron-sulfur cluster repair protein YtfE (RIC family)
MRATSGQRPLLQPIRIDRMPSSEEGESIEALCTRHPLAIPVLRRMGLLLEAPSRSLDAVCREHALDSASVRAAVTAEEEALTAGWRGRPVSELLDHILRTYHRPFAHELAAVESSLAATTPVLDVDLRAELGRALDDLRSDMELHMRMEEHVLFPWLRDPASTASAPIRAMELEHADTIHLLLAFPLPLSAEPPAVELAVRLRGLERWLCEHLHFESNELIPRALQIEM